MNVSRNLVVVGAGGHGRETANSALLQLFGNTATQFIGVLDDQPQPRTEELVRELGLRVLGPIAWLRSNRAFYTLGIGSPEVRQLLDLELSSWGLDAWTIIDPRASVGKANRIGDGVVIAPGAVVTTNVELGRHTHLNVNSSVSHDSRVGSYVTISPGAVICGSCLIEDGVYIGANACVLQGVTVGKGSIIGAGACVVADVEPGKTVVGVPARPIS
jgi:sugar O-acyltransferase (sialic acid O-acetyltransferase NeuD family)